MQDKFKLAPGGLIAIVEILRLGLTKGIDISQALRDLEFSFDEKGMLTAQVPETMEWSTEDQ